MKLKSILFTCLCVHMIACLAHLGQAQALWQGDFESNLILDFKPESPDNLDPVNVTIRSVNSTQQINSAFLYCNFTRNDQVTEGGYIFGYANSLNTEMYCLIPGYQNMGGTAVYFHVEAYDEVNYPISSADYFYKVVKNGSWSYSSFEENIQVIMEPESPDPYQKVDITIRSRFSDVPIKSAEISWQIDTPGKSPRNGLASFFSQSLTTMNATIPGYEGDSNVTFTITAYDQYYTSTTSPSHRYSVGKSNITVIYNMVIEVIDEYQKKPAEGATVIISNESGIVYTGLTTSQGLLMTPVMFHFGKYTVEVEYNSKIQTRELTIPYEDNNQITFSFAASAALVDEFVGFPTLLDCAGMLGALFIPLLICWVLYKKQRERLLALTEKKNTFGKTTDEDRKSFKTVLLDILARETKHPRVLTPLAFFTLGVFGTMFIPFYPWWVILIAASFIGVVSYKFPFSALLLLSLFVIGSAAYQTPEFGLVFLVFSLVVMLCSFYDWKFGFLVFLMIFLSRFGVSFMVPVFTMMIFSTFLSIAVTLCAGVFLILLVSASNYQIIGLIAGANHSTAFMMFTKPVVANFTPGTLGSVMGEIALADSDIIGSVLTEGFATSMLPFFVLAAWCFGIFLLSYLVDNKKRLSFTRLGEWLGYPLSSRKYIKIMFMAILFVVLPSFAAIYHFGYFSSSDFLVMTGSILLFIGVGAVIYTTVVTCFVVREMFREYFTSKIGAATVGARISEMADLGKTTFDQVGGLEDVKLDIKESILVPLLRPDIADKFGVEPAKGILLFGAPGCGKTLTMKALATELNVEMFTVKCGDLMSKWYGESETRMMTLFKTAKERKPAIIFFDEIDAVAKRRDLYSADDVTPRLLSIMLSELDGMDRASGIIIVGSTNKPELIDPALLRPGRFDKIIYVPPPDFKERIDVLKVHMTGKPLAKDIDLDNLAKRTEGFSGADLANLVKEGAINAMRRSMETKQLTTITQKDFLNVLPRIKPSISITMKEEYERIKMRYERKVHDLSRGESSSIVTLDNVAGLKDVKNELMKSVILPLTERKLVEKFKLKTGKAILLHSPPGCGKTYLMKAFSNQYAIPLQDVTGSELKNAINAEGSLAIKGLWSQLRDMAPAILYISDIDSIASDLNLKTEEGKKVLSTFLSMLDNIQPNDLIVVIAASENPDLLDKSLFKRGRFDNKIFIPPPDFDVRKKIFEMNLADVPKIGKIDFDALAHITDGYSGEDVCAVVEEAKLLALSKKDIFSDATFKKKIPLGIKMDHLCDAIKKIKPSVKEWKERKTKAEPKSLPPVPISPPPSVHLQQTKPQNEAPPPPPPPVPTLTEEDLAIMTIAQLENACRLHGLKPYGKKNVLQERLQDYLQEGG